MSRLIATREEYKDFIFDGKIPEVCEVDKGYYATGRSYHMIIYKNNVAALYDHVKNGHVLFTVLMPCGTLVYADGGNMSLEYLGKNGLYLGYVPIHAAIVKRGDSLK